MENVITASLIQNPDNESSSPFYDDNDSELLVTPLRFQPPYHITMSILRDDLLHVQWFYELPWRIESIARSQRRNCDVTVDVNAPHMLAFGEDTKHSTVHVRGVFCDAKTSDIQPIVLREGEEASVLLMIGSEAIVYNNLRCDVNDVKNKDDLFEKYWEGVKSTGVDRIVRVVCGPQT